MPLINRPAAVTEYRSRAIQYLDRLRFPATTADILAHFTRRNTPMELMEEAMALPARSFATAEEAGDALLAIHQERAPHTWTSREVRDKLSGDG